MGINLGDVFPNFSAPVFDEVGGLKEIKFHDWIGKDGYVFVQFSLQVDTR